MSYRANTVNTLLTVTLLMNNKQLLKNITNLILLGHKESLVYLTVKLDRNNFHVFPVILTTDINYFYVISNIMINHRAMLTAALQN